MNLPYYCNTIYLIIKECIKKILYHKNIILLQTVISMMCFYVLFTVHLMRNTCDSFYTSHDTFESFFHFMNTDFWIFQSLFTRLVTKFCGMPSFECPLLVFCMFIRHLLYGIVVWWFRHPCKQFRC